MSFAKANKKLNIRNKFNRRCKDLYAEHIIKHWRSKLSNIQTSGMIIHVYGLEELILICYTKQSADSVKFLSKYKWHFHRNNKTNLKTHKKLWNILSSHSNLEQKEQSCRPWYLTSITFQKSSNQNSIEQTHRPME